MQYGKTKHSAQVFVKMSVTQSDIRSASKEMLSYIEMGFKPSSKCLPKGKDIDVISTTDAGEHTMVEFEPGKFIDEQHANVFEDDAQDDSERLVSVYAA